jgi:hypothetical protein
MYYILCTGFGLTQLADSTGSQKIKFSKSTINWNSTLPMKSVLLQLVKKRWPRFVYYGPKTTQLKIVTQQVQQVLHDIGQAPFGEVEIETRRRLTREQWVRLQAVLVAHTQKDRKWQHSVVCIKEIQYGRQARVTHDSDNHISHLHKRRLHRLPLSKQSQLHISHEQPITFLGRHPPVVATRVKQRWLFEYGEWHIHLTRVKRQQGGQTYFLFAVEVEWQPTDASIAVCDHAHLLNSKVVAQLAAIDTLLGQLATE